MRTRVFVVLVVVCLSSAALAAKKRAPEHASRKSTADSNAFLAQQVPEHASRESTAGLTHEWTNVEIYLSIAVLVFAVIVLLFQTILISRAKTAWHPKSILRINGLTLIISAGLFLITAGYSADQVSPVMGLLGTIAGYLLGSGETLAKAG